MNPIKLKQMQEQARTLEGRIAELESSIQQAEAKLSEFVSADEAVRLSKQLERIEMNWKRPWRSGNKSTQEIEATA